MAALPFPSVILTKVRIQGCGALPCLALDPDFRQDDGIGGRCGVIGAAVCVEGGCGGRGWYPCPSPFVILTKVRIQGCGVLSCLALGPDFRQDDGLGWRCARGRGGGAVAGARGAVPPATAGRNGEAYCSRMTHAAIVDREPALPASHQPAVPV